MVVNQSLGGPGTVVSTARDDATATASSGGGKRVTRHTGRVDTEVPVRIDDVVAPSPTWRQRLRHLDRKLLLASLAIAVGVVLIFVALAQAVTGDEATQLPPAIESITPAPDAVQVLQQTQVVVDLAEGHEGELTVDGVPLTTVRLDELAAVDVEPGEQVDVPPGAVFEPGNATLTFTPGEGAPIEDFDPGAHTVSVVYWRTVDGRETARTYSWTFEVI